MQLNTKQIDPCDNTSFISAILELIKATEEEILKIVWNNVPLSFPDVQLETYDACWECYQIKSNQWFFAMYILAIFLL